MKNHYMIDVTAFWLRLTFGSMILFGHGLGKVEKMLGSGEVQFPELLGLPARLNLIAAGTAEFLGGALLIAGLFSRIASGFLIFTMFVAAFVVHSSDAFFAMNASGGGSKEFALIYLAGFVAILFLGSGKYSLDALLRGQKR